MKTETTRLASRVSPRSSASRSRAARTLAPDASDNAGIEQQQGAIVRPTATGGRNEVVMLHYLAGFNAQRAARVRRLLGRVLRAAHRDDRRALCPAIVGNQLFVYYGDNFHRRRAAHAHPGHPQPAAAGAGPALVLGPGGELGAAPPVGPEPAQPRPGGGLPGSQAALQSAAPGSLPPGQQLARPAGHHLGLGRQRGHQPHHRHGRACPAHGTLEASSARPPRRTTRRRSQPGHAERGGSRQHVQEIDGRAPNSTPASATRAARSSSPSSARRTSPASSTSAACSARSTASTTASIRSCRSWTSRT